MSFRRRLVPAVLLVGLAAALNPARPDAPKAGGRVPRQAVLPDGAVAFVSVDVAALWDHKAFDPVRDARGKLEFAWAVQSLVGFTPGEIDRLTVAWTTPEKLHAVVSTRKPHDPVKVMSALPRKDRTAVKADDLGVFHAPGAEFPYGMALSDDTLLLLSAGWQKDELGLRKGRPPGPLAPAATATAKHTLTVGLDVKAVAALPLPVGAPLLEAVTAVLTADFAADGAGKAELRLAFASPEKAAKAVPILKAKLDELAGWAGAQEKKATDAGPVGTGYPAPLLEWIGTTLKGVKVRADGTDVVAAADVKLDDAVSRVLMAVPDAALAARGPSAAENNVKQIVLALHNYESANGRCPGNSYDKDGKPLLSWRVHILPYIEQDNVYRQFKLDEPWDSEHNKKASQTVVRVFQIPGRPAPQPWETYFRSFVSPKDVKPEHRAWLLAGDSKGPTLAQITDGTSNTLVVAEAAEAVPWAKPDDLVYDGVLPLPKLGGPAGGYVVGFGDGSVRTFRRGQLDDQTMRYLISIQDGNVVNVPGR